jgi:hypothetical protein
MAYHIEVLENTGIIKVTYSGNVSLDERINVIHELCIDYKTPAPFKLLIDTKSITLKLTTTEQLLFATYVVGREELSSALIAVVAISGQVMNKTIVNKSAQLGHQIKVFSAEDAALTWLNTHTVRT